MIPTAMKLEDARDLVEAAMAPDGELLTEAESMAAWTLAVDWVKTHAQVPITKQWLLRIGAKEHMSGGRNQFRFPATDDLFLCCIVIEGRESWVPYFESGLYQTIRLVGCLYQNELLDILRVCRVPVTLEEKGGA